MSSVAGGVGDGMLRLDEERVRGHVDEVVRSSVEETLNGLLDAEADRLCGAERYERGLPPRVEPVSKLRSGVPPGQPLHSVEA